jgi:hypothetical protein
MRSWLWCAARSLVARSLMCGFDCRIRSLQNTRNNEPWKGCQR